MAETWTVTVEHESVRAVFEYNSREAYEKDQEKLSAYCQSRGGEHRCSVSRRAGSDGSR